MLDDSTPGQGDAVAVPGSAVASDAKLSPMGFAAKAFAMVCEDVDAAMTITDRLKALFTDTHQDLKHRVDKRIAFDWWCKEQLAAAHAAEAWAATRAEEITEAHKKFKEQVRIDLEAVPGVEFRGRLGKIWTQANNPGVDYAFGDKAIVTPEIIAMFGVPSEYVRVEEIPATVRYTIDSEKLKAALKAGKKMDWATLRESKSVRFPVDKSKKKQIEGEPEQ